DVLWIPGSLPGSVHDVPPGNGPCLAERAGHGGGADIGLDAPGGQASLVTRRGNRHRARTGPVTGDVVVGPVRADVVAGAAGPWIAAGLPK
ncbi:MAG TPA: hypothetical protein VGD91_22520, partial [Trebonia sp.]